MGFDRIYFGAPDTVAPAEPSIGADVVNNRIYVGNKGGWSIAQGSNTTGNESCIPSLINGYTKSVYPFYACASQFATNGISGFGTEVDLSTITGEAGYLIGNYFAALGSSSTSTWGLEVDLLTPDTSGADQQAGSFNIYDNSTTVTGGNWVALETGVGVSHTGLHDAWASNFVIDSLDQAVSGRAIGVRVHIVGTHAGDNNVWVFYNDANQPAWMGTGATFSGRFDTTEKCANTGTPAACTTASAGAVAVPTGTNPTLTVNTSRVSANSQIFVQYDASLGSLLGITCNATIPTGAPYISARTAGTNFTITVPGTVSTNKVCMSYVIMN